MSSNYKDFTAYNEEAENIRPTARIQLIQRILNAASLISSLGQGVPLRWAQSYKSFQVLKYVSGQDPVDVTSENAVSAVDSILHESESQLKASNDDMTTLCSELSNMELDGRIEFKDFHRLERNHYYRIGKYQISGSEVNFMIKTDGECEVEDKLCITDNTGYNNLVDSHAANDLMGYDGHACLDMCLFTTSTGRFAQFAGVFNESAGLVSSPSCIATVMFMSCPNTDGNSQFFLLEIKHTDLSDNESTSFERYILSSQISVTEGQILTYNATSTVNTNVKTAGAMIYPGEIPLRGNIPTSEALGLPDPSELIEILDQMA